MQHSVTDGESAHLAARPLGHGRFGSVAAVRVDDLIQSFDDATFFDGQPPSAGESQADLAACTVSAALAAATAPREVAVKTVSIAAEPRAAATELAFAERALGVAAARSDCGEGLWANVVEVLEAAADADAAELRLVLELLPGGPVASLPEFVPRAAADEDEVARREARLRRVARDVLAGLSVLHGDLRVLHRDVKPANVLLAADGTAKLADFGCCAVLPPESSNDDSATDQQGSLAYMAPERLRGEPHSFASDVWALGVTLLQLALGGAHPFLPPHSPGDAASRFWQLAEVLRHTSDDAAEREAATAAAVADAAARSGLSPAFASLCAACLASEAERRAPVAELRKHAWLGASVGSDSVAAQ